MSEENSFTSQLSSLPLPRFPSPPQRLQMIDSMFDNIENDIEIVVLPTKRKHSRLKTANESMPRTVKRNNYLVI